MLADLLMPLRRCLHLLYALLPHMHMSTQERVSRVRGLEDHSLIERDQKCRTLMTQQLR